MKKIVNIICSAIVVFGCSGLVLVANPILSNNAQAKTITIEWDIDGVETVYISGWRLDSIECTSKKDTATGQYEYPAQGVKITTDKGTYSNSHIFTHTASCFDFAQELHSNIVSSNYGTKYGMADNTYYAPGSDDCSHSTPEKCSFPKSTKYSGVTEDPYPSDEEGGAHSGSGSSLDGSSVFEGNIIDCSDYDRQEGGGVICILKLVLNVMTYGIGVLAVVGIVLSGIQYITSQGDPGKMAKAKNRIIQVVIGLVIYAVMYAALVFLVPGFNTDFLGRGGSGSIGDGSVIAYEPDFDANYSERGSSF